MKEVATFTREQLISPPGQPDEKQPDGSFKYAICCDRSKGCDCNGAPANVDALPAWMDTSLYL